MTEWNILIWISFLKTQRVQFWDFLVNLKLILVLDKKNHVIHKIRSKRKHMNHSKDHKYTGFFFYFININLLCLPF